MGLCNVKMPFKMLSGKYKTLEYFLNDIYEEQDFHIA